MADLTCRGRFLPHNQWLREDLPSLSQVFILLAPSTASKLICEPSHAPEQEDSVLGQSPDGNIGPTLRCSIDTFLYHNVSRHGIKIGKPCSAGRTFGAGLLRMHLNVLLGDGRRLPISGRSL